MNNQKDNDKHQIKIIDSSFEFFITDAEYSKKTNITQDIQIPLDSSIINQSNIVDSSNHMNESNEINPKEKSKEHSKYQTNLISSKNEIEKILRLKKLKETQAVKKDIQHHINEIENQIKELAILDYNNNLNNSLKLRPIQLSKEEIVERTIKAQELIRKYRKERIEKEKRDRARREKLENEIFHGIYDDSSSSLEKKEKHEKEKRMQILEKINEKKWNLGQPSFSTLQKIPKKDLNDLFLTEINNIVPTNQKNLANAKETDYLGLERKKRELSRLRNFNPFSLNTSVEEEEKSSLDSLRENAKVERNKKINSPSNQKKYYHSEIVNHIVKQDLEFETRLTKKILERKNLRNKQIEYSMQIKLEMLPNIKNKKSASNSPKKEKDIFRNSSHFNKDQGSIQKQEQINQLNIKKHSSSKKKERTKLAIVDISLDKNNYDSLNYD